MKAVIVEIKGKFVAALSEDGTFTQMKNDHYAVGQQIEVNLITASHPKRMARMSALAACCALVCGLGVGAYAYMVPAYYVSMDVNPSVEYTLNTFDRVLDVQAVNEDGAEILQGINLKSLHYKSIDEVMQLTLTEITREGYFDGGREGGIVLATSGKKTDSAEKLAAHLKQVVTDQCTENRKTVSVEAATVNESQMKEAKAMGVTPGKLLLVQKLLAEYPDAKTTAASDWLKMPVRDIMSEMERLDDLDDLKDIDDLDDDTDTAKDTEDDAETAKDDTEAEDDDDRPVVSVKPNLPLKHNRPAKPADSSGSQEKSDPTDPSDSHEKPDPADPSDSHEKPDPADPSDSEEKPNPADPPDSEEKPNPADPPDPEEKPDPADPPDPEEKLDPADPPDSEETTDATEQSNPPDSSNAGVTAKNDLSDNSGTALTP